MMPNFDTRSPVAPVRLRALRSAVALGVTAALAACVQGEVSGNGADQVPPTVSLSAGSATDSTVTFTITAGDNLGLLHVNSVATGAGIAGVCDTTFNSAVTTFTRVCTVTVPSTVPIGTTVTVLGQSVDGRNLVANAVPLLLATGGGTPSFVLLTQPKPPPAPVDTVVVGFSTSISITGRSTQKVKSLGWRVSVTFNPARSDSVVYISPLKDSVAQDAMVDFTGAAVGPATITPFMYDSLGRQFTGPPVNIVVVGAAGANTIPVVDFGITKRIEITDTIHVQASDRAGIASLGYVIRSFPLTNAAPIATGTFAIVGNVNTAVHTFTLALPLSAFPTTVLVQAVATNLNGRTDSARVPVGNTGFVRSDTVTVVAGLTRPLPNGGVVADGIYLPPPNDRLYLTNIERNELEVFNPNTATFGAPISVGSRPWGIAARPSDHNGTSFDSLIVANSGGTLISLVDVNLATPHEAYRYALPNIIFYTVTSAVLPNGQLVEHVTAHDFSDRPQYVAATCGGTVGACGDLIVAYTTTPTAGQSIPFQNQGTIRYENFTQRASHFFFEQAVGQGTQAAIDTIEIDRFFAGSQGPAPGGFGSDSSLVPFLQTFITGTDTSHYSVTTNTPLIGFRDTTFTRNSGNFQRTVFGEGGRVSGVSGQANARAMTYNEAVGMVTTFTDKGHTYTPASAPVPFHPVFDAGISRPGDVSDWIANTSTFVSGVAINFDGLTNAVRADSTALFDVTLRLQGLLQTSGGNPGMDFHPQNVGRPGPGNTNGQQLMFTASAQAEIDVWNTNTFQLCLVVPTRDPIIGPIKSARLATGDVQLVGATKFGVVVVTLLQTVLVAAPPVGCGP